MAHNPGTVAGLAVGSWDTYIVLGLGYGSYLHCPLHYLNSMCLWTPEAVSLGHLNLAWSIPSMCILSICPAPSGLAAPTASAWAFMFPRTFRERSAFTQSMWAFFSLIN